LRLREVVVLARLLYLILYIFGSQAGCGWGKG
jgi:hypothetical protein